MDKYPLLRKCFVVGIILLFITTFLIPVIAEEITKPALSAVSGNWLYVGGSGPGNYTRIQDAVDDASDGDIVFVYHGIYSDYFPENFACVKIEKKLTLIGENKYTTIIEGHNTRYDGVNVKSDYVTIYGFTIQNKERSGIHIEHPTGLDVLHNVIVHDTILQKNGDAGLTIFSSVDSMFYNNTILDNEYTGFEISRSSCRIHNNTIVNSSIGITDYGDSNLTIECNDIRNTEKGIFFAFSKVIIRYNNFINDLKPAQGFIEVFLIELLHNPSLLFSKNTWYKNYWDDWKSSMPRPIFLFMFIMGAFPPISFPVFIIPFIQFDWYPVQEPYDIPSMC